MKAVAGNVRETRRTLHFLHLSKDDPLHLPIKIKTVIIPAEIESTDGGILHLRNLNNKTNVAGITVADAE